VNLPTVRRSLAALPALALLATVSPLTARAAPEAYGVRLPQGGLEIEVPYSLGTHHEHVTAVEGTLRVDPETLRLERGRLVMPLAGFRSDDAKRGCHLREALGIAYPHSRYPKDHACDDQNKLPASGPDAIAFPEIVLALTQGGPAKAASPGAEGEVDVEGTLTVHGVSRPVKLHLAVSRSPSDPGMLRVRGRIPLRLPDFGVKVKSAGALFVSITVKDEVTVLVDALLEPVKREPQPRKR
jgi:polyisoprenoid-binding protein YceI